MLLWHGGEAVKRARSGEKKCAANASNKHRQHLFFLLRLLSSYVSHIPEDKTPGNRFSQTHLPSASC